MNAENISSVACVGGGTIGFSWAVLFAQHGMRVKIYDVSEAVLSRANAELRDAYDTLVEAGVMTEEELVAALDRITTTTDLAEAVKDVDYVQESGPERYRIKREIYRDLDRLARPDSHTRVQYQRHADDGDSKSDDASRTLRGGSPL